MSIKARLCRNKGHHETINIKNHIATVIPIYPLMFSSFILRPLPSHLPIKTWHNIIKKGAAPCLNLHPSIRRCPNPCCKCPELYRLLAEARGCLLSGQTMTFEESIKSLREELARGTI